MKFLMKHRNYAFIIISSVIILIGSPSISILAFLATSIVQPLKIIIVMKYRMWTHKISPFVVCIMLGGYISFSDPSPFSNPSQILRQRNLLSSFSNVKRSTFSNLPYKITFSKPSRWTFSIRIPSQLLLKWSICSTSVETFSDSSQIHLRF